jgi:5-methylcytosine-specific restriction protein A
MTSDVATTPRKPLTPRQRLKLFEDRKGLCHRCGLKIVGSFIDEHVIPLALGGSNDWSNRAVTHPKCAAIKTREEDMPRIAKAKRQKRAAHGIVAPAAKIESRGFAISEKTARRMTREAKPQAPGPSGLARRYGIRQ